MINLGILDNIDLKVTFLEWREAHGYASVTNPSYHPNHKKDEPIWTADSMVILPVPKCEMNNAIKYIKNKHPDADDSIIYEIVNKYVG